MANLNLSEFTEKLFVADADHTFIWDTVGAISKRVSRNSWLNSGTLTSDAPVTISQTWNNAAVAFTGLKVVATDTASGAASNLLELWSGNAATLKLSIRKSGQIVGPSGTIAAPTYGFADTDWGTGFSGWYRLGTGVACSTAGGTVSAFSITHTNIRIGASIPFGWTSNTAENALDTILLRDGAANTLALRNGTNAQTFNVYGTSSSSNTVYERMFMRYNGTVLAFQVGTEQVGATSRPLEFLTGGNKRFTLTGTGNNTATIHGVANATSNLLTLRNLSDVAKFQLYLNPSGNAEIYVGANALIAESGSSYFNGGNVGIGTTAPASGLHVAGALGANVTTYDSAAALKLTNTTGSSSWLLTSGVIGVLNASFCIRQESTALPALTIASTTNNVGIGTTAPSSKLHVAGDLTLPNGGSIFFGGAYNIYGTTSATTINGPTAFGQVAIVINGATKWVFNYDGLLCGGGTTASFPALKRSTTYLQSRLADDSAFAPIQGKLTTDTAYTGTVVAATGYITIYDSTGTAYRVPCAV